MVDDLSEEEREFMSSHRGGVFAILDGDEGAIHEARAAVAKLIEGIEELYPSRTERLLILSAFAHLTVHARDELLDEIIDTRYEWRQRDDGTWSALSWEVYERRQLASLADLGERAIHARIKNRIRSTLDLAKKAKKAACPDDPDGVHHVGCGCVE